MGDVNLSRVYSFEFRIALAPSVFTSNIVLLNYTFLDSTVQIFIFINGSTIVYQIGTVKKSFIYT